MPSPRPGGPKRVRISWIDESGEREHFAYTKRIGLSLSTFGFDTARSLAVGKHHSVHIEGKPGCQRGADKYTHRKAVKLKPKPPRGYTITRAPQGGFEVHRESEFLGVYADRYTAADVVEMERIKDEVR